MDQFSGQTFTLGYYLLLLFSIEAGFVIVWHHWRNSLSAIARRVMIGFGGLGLLRITFWGVNGLFEIAGVPYVAGVISLGVLVWSLAPYLGDRTPSSFNFLGGNTLLALCWLIVHNLFGAALGTAFNISWLVWMIGLSGLALYYLWNDFTSQRIWLLMGFVLLTGGSLLQLTLNPAATPPLFLRLAEMVAYPIFALALFQAVFAAFNRPVSPEPAAEQPTSDRPGNEEALIVALKAISGSLDRSQVLDAVAEGVVKATGVDQCAIALPEEGETSQLRMVANFNPRRLGRGEAVSFPLGEQAAIRHAMERGREVEINSGYETPQFAFLFALMGAAGETGPLLIQPLLQNGKALGVLIAGNPYARKPITPAQLRLIKVLADQAAIALEHARTHQLLTTKSQQLAWTLRNQEQDAGRRQAAMEAELKKNREEVSIISQRLYEQETLARKSQKDLTDYQQQVRQLSSHLKTARERLERLNRENQRLAQLKDSHVKQLDELAQSEELVRSLRDQVGELELRSAEVEKLRADLLASRDRSRKLMHALSRSRDKLQQLAAIPRGMTDSQLDDELENFPYGMMISDPTGAITRTNEAANRLFNATEDELVGKMLTELVPDNNFWPIKNDDQEAARRPVSIMFRMHEKVLKSTISPLLDTDQQEIAGHAIILYDATEEYESQRARDEFIASISQDLRTPMTSIKGYVDLLLGESVGVIADMQRKFLQRVLANIERMEMMLRHLIGVTTIDAGQLELKPGPLDMAEVIEDALIGAKAQIEEKEIQLSLELPEQMPVIEADRDSLQQVMGNLLANAAKSTPVGGDIIVSVLVANQENEISNTDDEDELWLHVSVTDSGGGIAAKDRERVFDRFYRAERPLIQGLGETGVGLSIVKFLIEAHGGQVWLETELGKGSTFCFKLPVSDYFSDPWDDLDVPPLDLNSNQSNV